MADGAARLGIGGSRRQDAIRFRPGWQSNQKNLTWKPFAIFGSGTVAGNGHKRHKKHKWCPLCLLCFLWLNNFFSKSHPILKIAEPQVCRQDDPPRCEYCKKLMDEQDGQDLISAVVRPVLLVIRTPATEQSSAVLRTRRVRELSRECGGSKCRSANAKRNLPQWRFSPAHTSLDPTSLTAANAAALKVPESFIAVQHCS